MYGTLNTGIFKPRKIFVLSRCYMYMPTHGKYPERKPPKMKEVPPNCGTSFVLIRFIHLKTNEISNHKTSVVVPFDTVYIGIYNCSYMKNALLCG